MDRTDIKIGDKVDIHFDNFSPLHDAEVILMPYATNGWWVVRTNTIHYVQNFAYLSLVTENKEPFEL